MGDSWGTFGNHILGAVLFYPCGHRFIPLWKQSAHARDALFVVVPAYPQNGPGSTTLLICGDYSAVESSVPRCALKLLKLLNHGLGQYDGS